MLTLRLIPRFDAVAETSWKIARGRGAAWTATLWTIGARFRCGHTAMTFDPGQPRHHLVPVPNTGRTDAPERHDLARPRSSACIHPLHQDETSGMSFGSSPSGIEDDGLARQPGSVRLAGRNPVFAAVAASPAGSRPSRRRLRVDVDRVNCPAGMGIVRVNGRRWLAAVVNMAAAWHTCAGVRTPIYGAHGIPHILTEVHPLTTHRNCESGMETAMVGTHDLESITMFIMTRSLNPRCRRVMGWPPPS